MHRLPLLALLLLSAPAQAQSYVCDLSPTPQLCYGNRKLASAYSGNALDVFNANTLVTTSIGFNSDRSLNTSALDTALASSIGSVTTWYGQVNSCNMTPSVANITRAATLNGTNTVTVNTASLINPSLILGSGIPDQSYLTAVGGASVTITGTATTSGASTVTFTQAPLIQNNTVGNARAIVFQGPNLAGSLFDLTSCDITARAITAKDYTVMLVLQPSSSMYNNQGLALTLNSLGTIFDLEGVGGGVARLYNNPLSGALGEWNFTDSGAFDFLMSPAMVMAQPIILTITSKSTGGVGVRIYQGNMVRGSAATSSLVRTATSMILGKLLTSVAGGTSLVGGFGIAASIVWNTGLSDQEVSRRASLLGAEFNINMQTTGYKINYVAGMGDSIAAGFSALGNFNMWQYAAQGTTYPIRLGSYGIAASTVRDTGGASNTTALYTTAVSPWMNSGITKLSRITAVLGGGNDSELNAPTARCVRSTNGSDTFTVPLGVVGACVGTTTLDTSGLTVGDYVYAVSINSLVTIIGIVPNTSIQISAPVGGTTQDVQLQFTLASQSPTVIATALAGMVTSAAADGGVGIIGTILPRNSVRQPWITETNVQIRSLIAANRRCELALDAQLSVNPGPMYFDGSHLTRPGQARAGVVWAGCLNSLLTAP